MADLQTHEFGRKHGKNRVFPPGSPFNDNVFPFDVTKLAQALPERLAADFLRPKREFGCQISDASGLPLNLWRSGGGIICQ